jgi:hypothetical protein
MTWSALGTCVSLVLRASSRSGVAPGESFASTLGSVPTMAASMDVASFLKALSWTPSSDEFGSGSSGENLSFG